MELEEGDIVLCTVTRISGTTVFVNIENNGKSTEGTIITSEIAPGRIRNLRDYVVPHKKIVCKILRTSKGHMDLSLRRVTAKEKKEVLEKHKREKNALSILKSVVGEKAEEAVGKIKKTSLIYDFLQACKDKPEKLEKYFSKEESGKICKILSERKEKQVQVKKEFSLSSKESDGLSTIKQILSPYKEKINYISAGKFLIKLKGENYKQVNQEAQKILEEIEIKAKEKKAEFEVKEKK